MKSSFTISGTRHLLAMLNEYPQLMGLSSFAGIREVGRKAKAAVDRSGCSCSAGPIYAQNAAIFEHALISMANGDHLIVKNLLKVDQLCYYVKTGTGNVLKCI